MTAVPEKLFHLCEFRKNPLIMEYLTNASLYFFILLIFDVVFAQFGEHHGFHGHHGNHLHFHEGGIQRMHHPVFGHVSVQHHKENTAVHDHMIALQQELDKKKESTKTKGAMIISAAILIPTIVKGIFGGGSSSEAAQALPADSAAVPATDAGAAGATDATGSAGATQTTAAQ